VTRHEHLQQLLDQQESRPQPDSSSPQCERLPEGYDPLADDPDFPTEDAEDLHIDETILDEEEGATAPRAEGNSPQPMDEQGVSTTEARNSETPLIADETTDPTTEVNPIPGHPPVATAAGGRRPSGQPIDNTRDSDQGHSSGATAAGDRSPPSTSDTIRPGTHRPSNDKGRPVPAREDHPLHTPTSRSGSEKHAEDRT
ncbi:hypothetical protein AAVH_42000, partial [Aphelenchoides avenae]